MANNRIMTQGEADVSAERRRQVDDLGRDADNDVKNGPLDWVKFIRHQTMRIEQINARPHDHVTAGLTDEEAVKCVVRAYRERFVKIAALAIAALAIAAVEAIDRMEVMKP